MSKYRKHICIHDRGDGNIMSHVCICDRKRDHGPIETPKTVANVPLFDLDEMGEIEASGF